MEDLNQNKIDDYLYEAERYEAESLYSTVGKERQTIKRQAIEIYSKVLKIAPTNFEALYSRATLYNFLGDYDKALGSSGFKGISKSNEKDKLII